MGRTVDVDDLLAAAEVAELLGLTNQKGVSVYAARHADFPEPVVVRANGFVKLWERSDIEAWRESHPARPTGG